MQQIDTNKSINIDLSHEVINSIIPTIYFYKIKTNAFISSSCNGKC